MKTSFTGREQATPIGTIGELSGQATVLMKSILYSLGFFEMRDFYPLKKQDQL